MISEINTFTGEERVPKSSVNLNLVCLICFNELWYFMKTTFYVLCMATTKVSGEYVQRLSKAQGSMEQGNSEESIEKRIIQFFVKFVESLRRIHCETWIGLIQIST